MSAAGRLQTMERLGIIMKFLDAEFVQGFIRMADDGWQQGWHERNGGNLSYRVKPEEVALVKENFEPKEFQLCSIVSSSAAPFPRQKKSQGSPKTGPAAPSNPNKMQT